MTASAYLNKLIISTTICPFPPLAFSSHMLELPHHCASYFAKLLSCNYYFRYNTRHTMICHIIQYQQKAVIMLRADCKKHIGEIPTDRTYFTFPWKCDSTFNSDKDLQTVTQNICKCCHVIFFNWIRVSWSFPNQTSFPLWSLNTPHTYPL